ncbi:S16 family serine protease [Actinoplanes sp. NPDC023714]|uniref:S16 family serine protease n=1 Tax=Actinoplanes sp. NPDC023714 TaxID=3154322 RepID=UPI0033D96066
MSRPGVSLAVGALVTAVLAAAAAFGPLPYVVEQPGPAVDVLGSYDGETVIAVTGADVSASAGKLLLTTVRVQTEVTLGDAVRGWFDDDRAVVPRSVVYPDGQTGEETDARNAELFRGSQTSAVAVALRTLKNQPAEQPGISFGVDEIGGPSAGLMFTLGIIDKLTPQDLTGGRIIAGTGAVGDTGAVNPIGGIPQKLRGAEAAGAQLFLVPEGNCTEALRNVRPGLTMARVATVEEALTAVATFTGGGVPEPC